MKITYQQFCKAVPSAVLPDDALFNRISDYIEQAESYVNNLTNGLLDLNFDYSEDPTTAYARATAWAIRLVCARAYSHAIPHIDLVLTSTGFGVVSNTNVAPASAERVNRLLDSLIRSEIHAYYRLIDAMRGVANWSDSIQAKAVFATSIIWNPDIWELLGGDKLPDVKDPIQANKRAIREAESAVQQLVSPDFYNEIVEAVRHASQDELMNALIYYVQTLVMSMVNNDHSAEVCKGELLTFLEQNLAEFPTYANSTAYKANHFKPYENKQDDSCYFFR